MEVILNDLPPLFKTNIMRKTFFFIFCFVLIVIKAQHYEEVKYLRTMSVPGALVKTSFILATFPKDNISSFVFEKVYTKQDSVTTKSVDEGEKREVTNVSVIYEKGNKNIRRMEIQKDYKKKQLGSYEPIYGEKDFYIVSELLPKIYWKIENETKEILGYPVQKASCIFRGRNYIAWFASKINIQDGPWKFNGLPGLILEIASTDNFIKFEAYQITLNKKGENLENLLVKYPNVKRIEKTKRDELERKNIDKQIKYIKSQNPDQSNAKIETNSLEIN